MKEITLLVSLFIGVFEFSAQCEFVGILVSSSSETQIQLYTPTPFFIPNPEANVHFWDITDTDGNVIIQETTDSDSNFFLFDHDIPLTDTIVACLSVTNEISGPGINCTVCDSIVYSGPIIEWEFLNVNGGSFEATEPPIPNYFLVGQSAPCPPRVINFQNFTFGSDSVHWTFQGGDPEFSNQETQLVTYNEPGDYEFTIEVFNSAGSTSFTSMNEITVYPNPTADFDHTSAGLTVTFENLSEGDLPGQTPEYLWDFGDSNNSAEVNPTHTYAAEGIYEVTLSITNLCGTNEIVSDVLVNVTQTEDLGGFNQFEVVPNPNNGQFELLMSGMSESTVEVKLVNTMGQIVWNENVIPDASFSRIPMDVSDLTPNVYFLIATSGGSGRSMKVIVE